MFICPPEPLPEVFEIVSNCVTAGSHPLPLFVMFSVNGVTSKVNVAPDPAPPVVGVEWPPGA